MLCPALNNEAYCGFAGYFMVRPYYSQTAVQPGETGVHYTDSIQATGELIFVLNAVIIGQKAVTTAATDITCPMRTPGSRRTIRLAPSPKPGGSTWCKQLFAEYKPILHRVRECPITAYAAPLSWPVK